MKARRLEPEVLDTLPPELARASLQDLVRINRWFGGRRVLLSRLNGVLHGPATVLDIGSASGDMGRAVLQRYPQARITCLDKQPHHLPSDGDRVVGDAFELPFGPKSFDIVMANLFLHHFENHEIVRLLHSFRSVARQAVVIIDLHRHPLAYHFLPATRWLFGWHDVTLHDGPISVAAAFVPKELNMLAQAAGFRRAEVRSHFPWFRVSLVAVP